MLEDVVDCKHGNKYLPALFVHPFPCYSAVGLWSSSYQELESISQSLKLRLAM